MKQSYNRNSTYFPSNELKRNLIQSSRPIKPIGPNHAMQESNAYLI